MANNSFEDFVIRNIVDTVDYDAENDKYIVNTILYTDELLSKLLKYAQEHQISENTAREIIGKTANQVNVECNIAYNQTNVEISEIGFGTCFVVYFKNEKYGRLRIELLSLNKKGEYLVLNTNIPGLHYKDILKSRNLSWNYGFSVEYGIYRNLVPYPSSGTYLLLEKYDGIEFHSPTYIHHVLDICHKEKQKKIIEKKKKKKTKLTILEIVDFVDLFVSEKFSKDSYNSLLSEALTCGLSSFQLNTLILRAKDYSYSPKTKEEPSSYNINQLLSSFQQPIIIREHEQENIKRIENLRTTIASLRVDKNKLLADQNHLKRNLQIERDKYDKLLKDYNDLVRKKSNKKDVSSIDWGEVLGWIIVGTFCVCILLNLIVPWFIPTIPVWLKFTLLSATGYSVYAVCSALEDNHRGKHVTFWGWSGTIAILLSTILTVYGIVSGFSKNESQGRLGIPIIENKKNVQPPYTYTKIPTESGYFYIDKYEVTQKDYVKLMGSNPSKYQGDSLPVQGMSVRDAVTYCNKKSIEEGYDGFYVINAQTVIIKNNGNGYRLPTEEEWMIAARYCDSNQKNNEVKPFLKVKPKKEQNTNSGPHIVGKKRTNSQNIYDMSGNISELCVRKNEQIIGKGANYGYPFNVSIDDWFPENENISSTKKLNDFFGLRLVLIPKR